MRYRRTSRRTKQMVFISTYSSFNFSFCDSDIPSFWRWYILNFCASCCLGLRHSCFGNSSKWWRATLLLRYGTTRLCIHLCRRTQLHQALLCLSCASCLAVTVASLLLCITAHICLHYDNTPADVTLSRIGILCTRYRLRTLRCRRSRLFLAGVDAAFCVFIRALTHNARCRCLFSLAVVSLLRWFGISLPPCPIHMCRWYLRAAIWYDPRTRTRAFSFHLLHVTPARCYTFLFPAVAILVTEILVDVATCPFNLLSHAFHFIDVSQTTFTRHFAVVPVLQTAQVCYFHCHFYSLLHLLVHSIVSNDIFGLSLLTWPVTWLSHYVVVTLWPFVGWWQGYHSRLLTGSLVHFFLFCCSFKTVMSLCLLAKTCL